jgi:hypothetical protein
MRNSFLHIAYWVIIALTVYLTFKTVKKDADVVYEVIKETIPGDSVPYPVKEYVPVVQWERINDTIIVNSPIDTQSILNHYFAVRYYSDTISDTSMLVIINDTVTQNMIAYRNVLMQNKRPIMIETTEIYNCKPKWFIGADVMLSDKTGVGIQALRVNNNHAWNIGYDLVNKGITAGYYFRFK